MDTANKIPPIRLDTPERRQLACERILSISDSPAMMVEFKRAESIRSLEQNRLMWALLNQLSQRALWHGRNYTAEQWKDILSAGLDNVDIEYAPGISGNQVALGKRTSKLGVKKMSLLIELIYAFGSDPNREGLEFDGFRDNHLPSYYTEYITSEKN